MIAITGASGKLGRATIQFLLQKIQPFHIIAIVRDPDKVKDFQEQGVIIRKADYNDYEELKLALEGVEKILQISSTTISGDFGKIQEKNVVLAAKAQGVKHIVYSSSLMPKINSHFLATQQAFATEKEIIHTGMNYTFFRNSLYMEVIPELIGNVFQTNEIRYPAGNGKVSFVSRLDIAEAMANVLLAREHNNNIHEITGIAAYSFEELTQLINVEKKKFIQFINISLSDFRKELISHQTPAEIVDLLVSLGNGIKSNEFSHVNFALEKLLGRKPFDLNSYISRL